MPAATRSRAGVGVAAVLLAVALVLAFQGDGSGDSGNDETVAADTSARFVDEAELAARADALGHELYWAGERPPSRLELKEEAGGSVYLRYLPPGVEPGDPRPGFLTVGTYPVADPVAALRAVAGEEGATLERLGDGGFVLVDPSAAGSAYLAYPGSELQVEVYDPAPGRALELIRAGAIRPLG